MKNVLYNVLVKSKSKGCRGNIIPYFVNKHFLSLPTLEAAPFIIYQIPSKANSRAIKTINVFVSRNLLILFCQQ